MKHLIAIKNKHKQKLRYNKYILSEKGLDFMLAKDVELIEYSKAVDFGNCLTHALGAVLALPGFLLLMTKADTSRKIVSAVVYCLSIFAVYTVSAVYHGLKSNEKKRIARLLDHSTVPLLIAGTATPCALITLYEISVPHCVLVLTLGWFCYFFGLFSKLFFFEKLKAITMTVYIVSGAVMLLSVVPILGKMHSEGFYVLVIGCVFYLIGAVLCGLGRKKAVLHVVFHIFVLLGSVVHFYAMYAYVFER